MTEAGTMDYFYAYMGSFFHHDKVLGWLKDFHKNNKE